MVGINAISISSGSTTITLSLESTTLLLEQPKKERINREIPCRNVIDAIFDTNTRLVKVTYLYKTKKKNGFELCVAEGQVQGTELASEWVDALMDASYAGIPRSRRLLIFINPYGGTKKGVSVFERKVRPILAAARCSMEVIHTTHRKHAYEVVKSIPLTYDAIITVSGDGLIHEVLNGFAHHADPTRAFATPVAPIPTGSGNGLSLNLLGIEEGFDVCAAALNVVKGLPMKTVGLMADLDLETEHLRWMGDSRFIYGFIKGVIRYEACSIQLSYKLAENDKEKMAKAVHATKARQLSTGGSFPREELPEHVDHPLQSYNDLESWTSFDEPIYYIFAGKGPYVGRDLMAFPVSLPNDGLIDIEIMANSSRADIIGATDGASVGKNYWHPKIQYMKVHAYRVKPLKMKGNLSVDGEAFPFEEYRVDVHKGLGTFLSLYGHYVSSFETRNAI